MAKRGDVLRLKRRLGFGAKGAAENVVVLQEDRLNALLATTLVAPLDAALTLYEGDGTAVPVTPAEAGAAGPQVVLTTRLYCLPLDRMEPSPVGKIRPATLARVDAVLSLVLGLRLKSAALSQ